MDQRNNAAVTTEHDFDDVSSDDSEPDIGITNPFAGTVFKMRCEDAQQKRLNKVRPVRDAEHREEDKTLHNESNAECTQDLPKEKLHEALKQNEFKTLDGNEMQEPLHPSDDDDADNDLALPSGDEMDSYEQEGEMDSNVPDDDDYLEKLGVKIEPNDLENDSTGIEFPSRIELETQAVIKQPVVKLQDKDIHSAELHMKLHDPTFQPVVQLDRNFDQQIRKVLNQHRALSMYGPGDYLPTSEFAKTLGSPNCNIGFGNITHVFNKHVPSLYKMSASDNNDTSNLRRSSRLSEKPVDLSFKDEEKRMRYLIDRDKEETHVYYLGNMKSTSNAGGGKRKKKGKRGDLTHKNPQPKRRVTLPQVETEPVGYTETEDGYSCDTCGANFKRQAVVAAHVKCHEEVEDDGILSESSEEEVDIKKEKNKDPDVKNKIRKTVFRPCLFCENFPLFENLAMHLRQAHMDKEEVAELMKLQYYEKNKAILGLVRQVHQIMRQNRRFVCNICSKEFTKNEGLKSHTNLVHNPNPVFYQCQTCGSKVKGKQTLKEHMKQHQEPKFECRFCGQKFRARFNVNMHERIHTGYKPHVCETCGKSFRRPHQLNEHLRLHMGIKPHECHFCGDTFTSKTSLNRHVRLHTGEKPHKCEVCEASFIQKNELYQHWKKHPNYSPGALDTRVKFRAKQYLLKTATLQSPDQDLEIKSATDQIVETDAPNTMGEGSESETPVKLIKGCCIHDSSIQLSKKDAKKMRKFSEKSWAKINECAREWVKLPDEPGGAMCGYLLEYSDCSGLQYHKDCYRKITNISHIVRAQRREQKKKMRIEKGLDNPQDNPQTVEEDDPDQSDEEEEADPNLIPGCCIHNSKEDDETELSQFTETTWGTITESTQEWLKLVDEPEGALCGHLLEYTDYSGLQFHRNCYRRLADISKIARAQRREEKKLSLLDEPWEKPAGYLMHPEAFSTHREERTIESKPTQCSDDQSAMKMEKQDYNQLPPVEVLSQLETPSLLGASNEQKTLSTMETEQPIVRQDPSQQAVPPIEISHLPAMSMNQPPVIGSQGYSHLQPFSQQTMPSFELLHQQAMTQSSSLAPSIDTCSQQSIPSFGGLHQPVMSLNFSQPPSNDTIR